jgi:hypothetical protein
LRLGGQAEEDKKHCKEAKANALHDRDLLDLKISPWVYTTLVASMQRYAHNRL